MKAPSVQAVLCAIVLSVLASSCSKSSNPNQSGQQPASPTVENNGPRSAANENPDIAAIRAAGEPVTPAELNAWYPEVAAGQNAATIYAEAFAALPENSSAALPPLSQVQKPLQLLHQAAARTQCRYAIDLSNGFKTMLPHLAKVKLSAKLLQEEALQAASAGRMDPVAESILASLALARSLEEEPILISQLVRVAALDISVNTLEQCLWRRALTDEQMIRLELSLQAAEAGTPTAFARAMAGERCNGLAMFQLKPEDMSVILDALTDSSSPDASVKTLLSNYAKSDTIKADQEFYVDHLNQAVEIFKVPFPSSLDKAILWGDWGPMAKAKSYWLSAMLLPGISKVPEKSAIIVAELRVGQAVLAVERYRHAHQNALPDSLNDLVPQYLKAVPADPFDGALLRFKTIPQRGYMVYSIGKDRQDDGGIHKPVQGASKVNYDIVMSVLH